MNPNQPQREPNGPRATVSECVGSAVAGLMALLAAGCPITFLTRGFFPDSMSPLETAAAIGLQLGIPLFVAAMVGRQFVRMAVRRRAAREGLCQGCGYDLRGLAEPRCPECGRGF